MLYWFVMFVFFSLLTPCCVRWAVLFRCCLVLFCYVCIVLFVVLLLSCVLFYTCLCLVLFSFVFVVLCCLVLCWLVCFVCFILCMFRILFCCTGSIDWILCVIVLNCVVLYCAVLCLCCSGSFEKWLDGKVVVLYSIVLYHWHQWHQLKNKRKWFTLYTVR